MKISVLIPAFNEEKNIENVVKLVQKSSIVDEIIVIDNNSDDDTGLILKKLNVKTLFCQEKGKGYAMEYGLKHAKNEIIVFLDADIPNYQDDIIFKMTNPILNEDYDFVKSCFTRDGGRVTELVAKPLLELLFPDVNFAQPLSGVIAGKKDFFLSLDLEKDYGIDIGILLDAYIENAKIKEVDIGTLENISQDWKDLKIMAKQVARAILKRAKKSDMIQ